ncbi:MAG: queuosine precursor transporter [Alphaproteobacteria bacterium]
MSLDPSRLIAVMNGLPPEAIWLITLLVCFASILLLLRLFGAAGLFIYIAVAVIGANLQVLKLVQFSAFANPVALGTILFSTTYLCTDILTEYYGVRTARRAVALGFSAYLLMTVLMLLTLGYRPLTAVEAGPDLAWALDTHGHLAGLFIPAPAIFAAGMTAYLASQFHDVWMYRFIGRLTGGRWLWLRNNGSTLLSGLIDNTIFSVLAFVVLAPQPVGLQALVFTFILGTYAIRVVVAVLDTPFLYLARRVIPRRPVADEPLSALRRGPAESGA